MEAVSAVDVVHYASQIGRLDFLSAAIAVLAVILGLGAFPVFFFVQRRAERVARDAVDTKLEGAEARIEKLAIAKMEAMLPALVDDYMEVVKNSVSAEQGNKIAEALAKEDGDDDNDQRGQAGAG